MMSYTAQELTDLKNAPSSVHLLAFQIGATNYYLTDSDAPITYGGQTYQPGWLVGDFDDVETTSEPRTGDLDIEIYTHDPTYLTAVLSGGWMNKPVTLLRHFFKNQFEIKTIITFDGLLSSFSIDEKSNVLTLTASSIWADYEKKAGMKTNVKSHQIYFPGDTGMRHAANASKKIYWGKDNPTATNSGAAGGGISFPDPQPEPL